MKLLIAEKPSAAREFRKFLEKEEGIRFSQNQGFFESDDYKISWCIGHLIGLAYPDAYGWKQWNLNDLPLVPKKWKYEILPNTKKQFDILKKLIQEADVVINGTDAGREGELIYRLSMLKAGGLDKEQYRLWINSFVFKDMQKAWKEMKPASDYVNLFKAAICRAKADWIIGMSGSRGYSVGTGNSGLSVGRVQTPTLSLIVERDRDVETWKDKHYYQLTTEWQEIEFTFWKNKQTKFEEKELLDEVKKVCTGKDGTIQKVSRNEKKQYSQKLFDLPGLQMEANKRLSLKAADTLKAAQSLYEKKYISYPRTDSQYLPENMIHEAFDILDKVAAPKHKPILQGKDGSFRFFNSKKVTDHYAIIPTGHSSGLKSLPPIEQKVYELIRRKYVAAFAKPKVWDETKILLNCEGHFFITTINKVTDKGYTVILSPGKEDKKEDVKEVEEDVKIEVGEEAPCKKLKVHKKKVTPPRYYTEGTLLKAMETAGKLIEDDELAEAMKERGLGTPATKAQIIETLKKRQYVLSKGKNLISTEKGRWLISIVDEKLKSPELTGDFEYKLTQINRGAFDDRRFMHEVMQYARALNATYRNRTNTRDFSDYDPREEQGKITCPKCGNYKLDQSEKAWYCPGWKTKQCDFAVWRKFMGKKLSDTIIKQLLNGKKTRKLKGFKSTEGDSFDAALVLGKDLKVAVVTGK